MALIQYLSRIQFGEGSVELLADEIQRLGIGCPLLITDRGLVQAGILERVLCAACPIRPVVYSGTTENPHESSLRECLVLWETHGCDGLIALGGGSPIDLSKAVALLATHDGCFSDYDVKTGGSEVVGTIAPQIAIPTAAGTGAEVGRASVLTLDSGRKCVAVNLRLVADCVLCDPGLTRSLPPRLTAATGIDALSHGIEAYLSTSYNPPADAIALDCVKRISKWLRIATADGNDGVARSEMMMAALEGGMILQKGLGGAHALANVLGEKHLHHGTLIGVLLPHVLRFNQRYAKQRATELASVANAGSDLAEWVASLVSELGLPNRLGQLGVSCDEIPVIARRAVDDHLARTNPVPLSVGQFESLLRDAL